jgi:hypothetical protein
VVHKKTTTDPKSKSGPSDRKKLQRNQGGRFGNEQFWR